jgi:pyrroloquinoline quinone (PQQ) biosynthesis protein C
MKKHIRTILEGLEANPNPFFEALRADSMSKEDFVETQAQFFHNVKHFHRPMRALADRIPRDRNRNLILQNVADELGNGDASQSHENTFIRFLNRLDGLSEHTIRNRFIWPEVSAFNSTVDRACNKEDYRYGAAFMGMVERIFAPLSGQIGSAVLRQGWLDQQALVHYSTHEFLDIQHADDFFSVAAPDWESDSETIIAGLEEGAVSMDKLYRSLFHNRKQRIRQ